MRGRLGACGRLWHLGAAAGVILCSIFPIFPIFFIFPIPISVGHAAPGPAPEPEPEPEPGPEHGAEEPVESVGAGMRIHSAGPENEPSVEEPVEIGPPEIRLHGAVTYGIGGQSFLGGLVHGTALWPLWARLRASGDFSAGIQLHYGNEPVALAPWQDPAQVQGAAHRLQAVVTLGHTLGLGRQRRVGLGFHAFGGINLWRSAYRVTYADEGVSGAATVTRVHALIGAQGHLDVRLSRRLGLFLVAGGPFPTRSSYVITIFSVGLGLTVRLR